MTTPTWRQLASSAPIHSATLRAAGDAAHNAGNHRRAKNLHDQAIATEDKPWSGVVPGIIADAIAAGDVQPEDAFDAARYLWLLDGLGCDIDEAIHP